MKKITHAWLAFMAVKRLMEAELSAKDRATADVLVKFFMDHKDDVTQGAWYPDDVYRDNSTAHVYKLTPSKTETAAFRKLPSTYEVLKLTETSALRADSFTVAKGSNLPNRCEAIAHSIVDNLRILASEAKGSPVAVTSNHIALIMFSLSHYIADGHVPFHADARQFSEGDDVHGKLEAVWEDEIKKFYETDISNERFHYDLKGLPLRNSKLDNEYQNSFLSDVEHNIAKRRFIHSYGADNDNILEFSTALCHHAYLLSFEFIPQQYDHKNVPKDTWHSLGAVSLEKVNTAVLSDAVDSIARVWLRIWARHLNWVKKQ